MIVDSLPLRFEKQLSLRIEKNAAKMIGKKRTIFFQRDSTIRLVGNTFNTCYQCYKTFFFSVNDGGAK